jgi:NAD(P)-dependent dehydrogenase (short-subunit alcohol dehydrogenase family)
MADILDAHSAVSSGRDRPLAGRHAIVTGAALGVGAAIAGRLAAAGANVSVMARDEASILSRAEQIAADHGVTAHGIVAEVTDEQDIRRGIRDAVSRGGVPTILVNNAGRPDHGTPFLEETHDNWQRTLSANLTGVFACSQEVLPGMIETGYGRIVNLASTAGLTGYGEQSAYCAATHAIVGMTRALAMEVVGHGITVNALCPGYVDTGMTAKTIDALMNKMGGTRDEALAALVSANPQARLIDPEELAETALWLCLPNSASVTGQAVAIAGGEMM